MSGTPITTRVELEGGRTVLIGPLQPSDRERYLGGLRRASADSMYKRFMTPLPRLTASQLAYLIDVDHRDHEALLAIDEDSGEAVGVGRFVRLAERPATAEAAVLVIDDWQGKGLGAALCRALADRATETGIDRFEATMLSGNRAMRALLESLGEVRQIGTEGSAITLELLLPEPTGSEPITGSLRPVEGDCFALARSGGAQGSDT